MLPSEIFICRDASRPLPGSVGGFACRACGKAVEVTRENAERARHPNATVLCNRCGFALAASAGSRGLIADVEISETVRASLAQPERRRQPLPKCDFCTRPAERLWVWRQTSAFEFRWPGATAWVRSPVPGAWAACEDCRPLVESRDLDKLVERCAAVSRLPASLLGDLFGAVAASLDPGDPVCWRHPEPLHPKLADGGLFTE